MKYQNAMIGQKINYNIKNGTGKAQKNLLHKIRHVE